MMSKYLKASIAKNRWVLFLSLVLGFIFRFYKIGEIPLGHTWDEVAIAYDAWGIADWGRDQYMVRLPLVFQSFGDFKAPVMIYLLSGLYWIFGVHLIFGRVLSATAGVILIYVVYKIARLIFPSNQNTALLSSMLIALSPWSLHISRVGFEANIALLFFSTAVWFFLKGLKKPWWWLMSTGFFCLSMHTYHSAKIAAPLMIILLTILFYKKLLKFKWYSLGSLLILIFGIVPFFISLRSGSLGRASQSLEISGELSAMANIKVIARNAIKHLSLDFIVKGRQETLRHLVPGHGVMLVIELLLLILAMLLLWMKKRRILVMLVGWLLIGLLPSIVSKNSPNAIRAMMAIPAIFMMISYGAVEFFGLLNKKVSKNSSYAFAGLVMILYSIQFSHYLHAYYTWFPQASAYDYQYGYVEALEIAKEYLKPEDNLYITTSYGHPNMYAFLSMDISPKELHEGSANNIEFKRINWPNQLENAAFIGTPEEIHKNIEYGHVVGEVKIPETDIIMFVVAYKDHK